MTIQWSRRCRTVRRPADLRRTLGTGVLALAAAGWAAGAMAASHREAPITSLDRTADITDFYAFVSPDDPKSATAIMCTDPLLEPANGPNYFPFDPSVLYEINVDNDHDARADLTFSFRFKTEIRVPGIPVGFAGANGGIGGVIPPQITALDGAGSEGLSLRQTYDVELVRGSKVTPLPRAGGGKLFAVPSNVGPRTMDYAKLYKQGAHSLGNGIQVFAGTVDDAFAIDLGAAFDSLNFRAIVLSEADDKATTNQTPDDVSGYNVNCIAVQVPIPLLSASGKIPTGDDGNAKQIGLWATTSRAQVTVRNARAPNQERGGIVQIQRMANPLFNELLIPTEEKDRWSKSAPRDERQFQKFVENPAIVQIGLAAFPILKDFVPPAPRTDLSSALGFYSSGKPGPFADLLRLDLSVPPTPGGGNRLGGCAGDPGGFPNGRRLSDDVTDCFLRVGFGLLKAADASKFPRLGDGVNVNDKPFMDKFPYLGLAQDGRGSRHVDPGEPGCVINGAKANCPD